MSMQLILDTVRALDGMLELAPVEGSEHPEIAWGDHFFYYSPDGAVPQNTQPFATIVTKDYPDDTSSRLDPEDRWRVNIHVGAARFGELTGTDPHDVSPRDFSETDVVVPHPVYASLGWVAVVNPGDATTALVVELLRAAHEDARRRAARRATAHDAPDASGGGG